MLYPFLLNPSSLSFLQSPAHDVLLCLTRSRLVPRRCRCPGAAFAPPPPPAREGPKHIGSPSSPTTPPSARTPPERPARLAPLPRTRTEGASQVRRLLGTWRGVFGPTKVRYKVEPRGAAFFFFSLRLRR
ncbi:hypothetical protein SEVIR_2G191900v4 [Setaria viridis]|uniref:Uncharacterized protein n=1 Tax=Setaria viridis TaxID=4556 RepID=A0A4U6VSG4_SETVI|nr:hypothetical protein SEVIR_2G191900v2 [Setaria viridis]